MSRQPEEWHAYLTGFVCLVAAIVPAVVCWRAHRRAFPEWWGWTVSWCGAICVAIAIWFIAWFCVFSIFPSFHEATRLVSLSAKRSTAGTTLDTFRLSSWFLAVLSLAPALVETGFLTRAMFVTRNPRQRQAILTACAIWGTAFGLGASLYSIIVSHGGSSFHVVDANAKSLRDWLACGPWTEPRIAQSKEIGNQVVAAIARYKADHGVHPERLSDLIPRYLEEIPAPVAGSPNWGYSTHSWQWPNAPRESNFRLSFGYGECRGRGFFSTGKGWIDDSY